MELRDMLESNGAVLYHMDGRYEIHRNNGSIFANKLCDVLPFSLETYILFKFGSTTDWYERPGHKRVRISRVIKRVSFDTLRRIVDGPS